MALAAAHHQPPRLRRLRRFFQWLRRVRGQHQQSRRQGNQYRKSRRRLRVNNSAWPCVRHRWIKHCGPRSKGINESASGKSPKAGCGVWGDSDEGYGVYGSSKTGTAGAFDGDVSVTGNVTANDVILSGADCAEEFDIANACQLEPGTVVVFDDEGALSTSDKPYNKRVAGVVSGAGAYRQG